MKSAPFRTINPALRDCVDSSSTRKTSLSVAAGFTQYASFFETLRADSVRATPLTVTRLQRVADAVGFPRDEIFVDEVTR